MPALKGLPSKLRVAADVTHKSETRWIAQTGDGTQYAWEIPAGECFGGEDLARWIAHCGRGGEFPVRVQQLQIHPERALCYGVVWGLDGFASDDDEGKGDDGPKPGWARLVPSHGIQTGLQGSNALEKLVLLLVEQPDIMASIAISVTETLKPAFAGLVDDVSETFAEKTSRLTAARTAEAVRAEIHSVFVAALQDEQEEIGPAEPQAPALPSTLDQVEQETEPESADVEQRDDVVTVEVKASHAEIAR